MEQTRKATHKYSYVKSRVDTGISRVRQRGTEIQDQLSKDQFDGNRDEREDTTQIQMLQKRLKDKEDALVRVEDKLQQCSTELSASKAEILKIQTECRTKLRLSLHAFQDEKQSVAMNEEEIDKVVSQFEKEMEELRNTLHDMNVELVTKTSLMKELGIDLEAERMGREHLLKTLADIVKGHAEDVEDLSSSLNKLLTTNNTLHDDNEKLIAQMKEKDFVTETQRVELRRLEERVKKYEVELNTVTSTNALLQRQLETALPVLAARCVQELNVSCQTDAESTEVAPTEVISEPNIIQTNVRNEEVVGDDVPPFHNESKEEIQAQSKELLVRRDVERLESKIGVLQKRCKELTTEVEELKRSQIHHRIAHRKEIRELNENLAKKDESIFKLSSEAEMKKEILEVLSMKQDALVAKEKELDESKQIIEKLSRRIDQNNLTNRRLKATAVLLEEIANETDAALNAKCEELEAIRRTGDSQAKEVNTLRGELSMLKVEQQQILMKNKDVRHQLLNSQSELEAQQKKVKSLEDIILHLEQSTRSLQEEALKREKGVIALQKEKDDWVNCYKKLYTESADRFAEKCIIENKTEAVQKELDLAYDKCRILWEKIALEQEETIKCKKLASAKERELLARLGESTTICDKFREELENLKRKKRTLREKLFGGEKGAKVQDQLIPTGREFMSEIQNKMQHKNVPTTMESTTTTSEKENNAIVKRRNI